MSTVQPSSSITVLNWSDSKAYDEMLLQSRVMY